MSTVNTTVWPLEPHTKAKHVILRKYLDAWLPIMARWNGRILYIDGFAGPGAYEGGEDGSPLIAIKAVSEHTARLTSEIKMLFIERDEKRCAFLKNQIFALAVPENIKITEPICGTFEDTVAEIFKYLDEQKKAIAPAFVFVDPFGWTGLSFDIIKKIMSNPKCEVLITFMYEELNRFVTDKKLWDGFTRLFGTEDWKGVLSLKNPEDRCVFLHNVYKKQLESGAGIKFVRSFRMFNKNNKTDYFLFFGTNNKIGLKKMKEAMWRVDVSGQFQFSDATFNPSQPTLFTVEPPYEQLIKILVKNFSGQTKTIKEIEDFVLINTPFVAFKEKALRPLVRTGKIVYDHEKCVSGENCKKRKGFFPVDWCRIKFL